MAVQRSIFCVLLISVAVVSANFYKFEDCSRKDGIADVSVFTIGPDPVRLDGDMTIDMGVKILTDVPPEAVLRTRYHKRRTVFGVNVDIPIPCLLGKFGSCTRKLCDYLDDFRDQVEPMFPEGIPYGCPVKAGEYGGKDVQIEIPNMSMVARVIVSGYYRTELKLYDRRGGKELACYKILTELR